MDTNFSHHAYGRVAERLAMEPDQVADLLDWNLAVKIGEEKGTTRVHRVFFSRDDSQWFVAVQDERTGTVVTILPVDYYEHLAARVPQRALDEAKWLVSCQQDGDGEDAVRATTSPLEERRPPRSFKISGTLSDLDGKPRTVSLGSWPAEHYGGSTDSSSKFG